MVRNLNAHGLHLPIVRKVIRKGDVYVCSLCRSEYSTGVEANNCLNHCWFDLKNFHPVVLRKSYDKLIRYRCHFCCRDYETEDLALACAKHCLEDRMGNHIREQLVNDLPLDAPPKRPSQIRVKSQQALFAVQPQRLMKRTKQQDLDASALTSEESATTRVALDKIDRGRHISSFQKTWIRKNEKYQCRYCNQLYYTRLEVETCFGGHFNEEGYEKKKKLPGG